MTEPQPGVTYWEAPEEVAGPAPGVRFAPHVERLLSYLLDSLIVAGLSIVGLVAAFGVLAVTVGDGRGAATGVASVIALVLFLAIGVVLLGYLPWFWARGGQTPGMKPFGLRVVRDVDGGPVGGGAAIIRLLGMWISAAVMYIGLAWVLVDKRRRGWHDLLAGTVVIKQG